MKRRSNANNNVYNRATMAGTNAKRSTNNVMFWEFFKSKLVVYGLMAGLLTIAVTSVLLSNVMSFSITDNWSASFSKVPTPYTLSYEEFYRQFAKPLLRVRHPGSQGTKQTVQFLTKSLTESGLNVKKQEFTDKDPDGKEYNFVNVWAETNPDSKKRVVLSCHHDSKLLFFRNSKVPFMGAIDSAIPCAILLYLAALIGNSKTESCSIGKSLSQLNLNIVFIFFDGEEAFADWTATDSLYGSRYFANNIDSEIPGFIKSIRLFVLLDLIGTNDMQFKVFHHARENSCYKKLQSIEKTLKTKGTLKSCNADFEYHTGYKERYFSSSVLNGGVSDDHEPFMKKGVSQILHLIPVPFPTVWHRETDNEDSLHHPTIENLLQILTVFVQDLSCVLDA